MSKKSDDKRIEKRIEDAEQQPMNKRHPAADIEPGSETNPKDAHDRGSFGGMVFRRMFTGGKKDDLKKMDYEYVESPAQAVWNDFKSRGSAIAGMVGIIFMIVLCFAGPYIWPVDILEQDPTMQNRRPGFHFLDIPNEVEDDAVAVSMGNSFGAGVNTSGELYVWGETNEALEAIPEIEDDEKWIDVACGNTHIIALTDKGNVYSWGDKQHGLMMPPPFFGKPVKVYAGRWLNSVIDDAGKAYYWGAVLTWDVNTMRIREPIVDQALARSTAIVLTAKGNPYVLDRSKGNIFGETPKHLLGKTVDVAATDQTVFAVTEDGEVTAWGRREEGLQDIPEEIQGHVVQISAGTKHVTALLDDGSIYSWGSNKYGQHNVPERKDIEKISAGYHNTLYISEDGEADGIGLKGYLMGTDENGRDIFRRLIYGGRMSLTVGAVAVIISSVIGILIGGLAGYFGGWVDMLLMRIAEIINAIPFLPLAMILSAIVQEDLDETGRIYMIMVILGVLSWPGLARLVRGQILAIREQEYVTAAESLGIKERGIIFRHILPNVMNVILVSITLSFATSILTESSLSFLGFGVTLPTPTWGNMVFAASNSRVVGEYWWRWLFPSLALAISTLSINMIGDALRDAVDPKTAAR